VRARPRRGILPASGVALNGIAVGLVGVGRFIHPLIPDPTPTFKQQVNQQRTNPPPLTAPPKPIVESKTMDNLQVGVVSAERENVAWRGGSRQLAIRLRVTNLGQNKAVLWRGVEPYAPSLRDDVEGNTYTLVAAEGAPAVSATIAPKGAREEVVRFGIAD